MKESKLELQSTETRKKIMNAADSLFFTNGYAETSVDDICHAAGVTKGAFYHHFKNKDVVYSRCYIPRLDRYLAEHYSICENPTASERFIALARCTFASSVECGRELVAQSLIGMLTDRESRLFEGERIHTRLLHEACTNALEEGIFPHNTSEDFIIMLYACLMNGFLIKWASADETTARLVDWDALLTAEITLFTSGL